LEVGVPQWITLPREPDPARAPALLRFLRGADDALQAEGCLRLPPIAGLATLTWVRWLYRAWLEAAPRWRALVHLDPALLPAVPRRGEAGAGGLPGPILTELIEQAAGGWLFLGPGWATLAPLDALVAAARARSIRLLLDDPALPPVAVPTPFVQHLRWLDPHHRVAVDPSLSALRRSLSAQCRAGAIVHLSGPAGSGKRSLARWAQAELAPDRGLSVIRAPQPDRVSPGRWLLFEELSQLDPAWIDPLRARLADEETGAQPPMATERDAPPRPDRPELEPILGESPAIRRVLDRTVRIARSALPVLVRGESGVGKEAMAEAIHRLSGRTGPLITVDLSSRSESLIESELFGHVKGAFTGALRDHRGCFQDAHRGTLFLDELGNLPLSLQTRLLRAIQQREVVPVGGSRPIPVDVRIVAATNADLEADIRRGTFRQDLLYRLNPGAALWLPPLRERPEDILLLAERFLAAAAEAIGEEPPPISAEAADRLLAWSWPGNIRELKQVIETAHLESGGGPIEPSHLGPLGADSAGTAPLLLTSSDPEESWERAWPLRRDEVHRLRAVTLPVLGLHDRDPRGVRSAVLASLDGRPIRADTLHILEHRAWWGHYTELDRALEAIRSNVAGLVDTPTLEARLPHLVSDQGRAPISVLLFPSRGEDGQLRGLRQRFREGAVVVGRAGSLRDLEPQPRTPPEVASRLRRRASALHQLLGQTQPGFLRLDLTAQIARAHLLLRRGAKGLEVLLLPEVDLAVEAWGADDAIPQPVLPDRPVPIGAAGEVRLLSGDGEQVLVRFYVFDGPMAEEDLAPRLLSRVPADAAAETLAAGGSPPSDAAIEAERGYRGLDPVERAAFRKLIADWLALGGAFAVHVRTAARRMAEEPGLGWLSRRLDTSHPTQDCGRLVEHKDNETLRAELIAELRARPQPQLDSERLPKRLRDALAPRVG
jgi:transcriptional regulator with AAA-type ATPase domain